MTSEPGPVILYSRVSTDAQADNGHSLDAQREQLERYAETTGLTPYVSVSDVASGRTPPDDRASLGHALAMLADGRARGLMATRVDRLSRDLVEIVLLTRRAIREGWTLVALDAPTDASTATGKLSWMMSGLMAEHEADRLSERTREGLEAARRKGRRLGAPVSDATRQAGRRGQQLRAEGRSWAAVAAALEAEGYVTATGRTTWARAQARAAVQSVELDDQAHDAASGNGID